MGDFEKLREEDMTAPETRDDAGGESGWHYGQRASNCPGAHM